MLRTTSTRPRSARTALPGRYAAGLAGAKEALCLQLLEPRLQLLQLHLQDLGALLDGLAARDRLEDVARVAAVRAGELHPQLGHRVERIAAAQGEGVALR